MTVPPHGQGDPTPTPGPLLSPAEPSAADVAVTPSPAPQLAPASNTAADSLLSGPSTPEPVAIAPATAVSAHAEPPASEQPSHSPSSTGSSPVFPVAMPAVIPAAPQGNTHEPIFVAPYGRAVPTQGVVDQLQKTAAATKPAPRGVRKWWLWGGSLLSALALFGVSWLADVATPDVPDTDTSQLVLGTEDIVSLTVPNSAQCEVESPSTSAYEGATYKCASGGAQYHVTSMVMAGNSNLPTVLERGVRYLVGLREQPNLQVITGASSQWNAAAYSAEFTGGEEDYGYMLALQPVEQSDLAIVTVVLAQDEMTGETVFEALLDSAGLSLQAGNGGGRGGQPLDSTGEGREQSDGGILASWPSEGTEEFTRSEGSREEGGREGVRA